VVINFERVLLCFELWQVCWDVAHHGLKCLQGCMEHCLQLRPQDLS
jgi:hypothetical protein